jgi:hypothetical protein
MNDRASSLFQVGGALDHLHHMEGLDIVEPVRECE